jgi:hypothetical protein
MNDDYGCTYPGDRTDALITHLYGEHGSGDAAFAAHVETCAACRDELDELAGVRSRLGAWAPPEPAGALAAAASPPPSPRRVWRALAEIPAWAQIAAASLIVGMSVGVANLDVRYGSDGLTVHSGWWRAAAAPAAERDEPWRAELAALRAELQTDLSEVRTIASAPDQAPAQAASTDESQAILRQVRALIAESDRRHQRELALRVGEVLRDVNVQRRADLQNIDRSIGTLQNTMGMELLKQREQVNNYMLRVSSQK